MRDAWLGVDAGGTWLRVAAVDAGGRVLAFRKLARVPRAEWPRLLKAFCARARLKPRAVVLGSTGLGSPADQRRAAARLKRVAPRARALTDVELAWLSALGRPGVLILAGTGSLAYGKDARGRVARVGGLGPYLGDEGSAFWIGREWLRGRPEREALAYAHKPHPQSAVASLARRVLKAAAGRSAQARRARLIVARAQAALSEQALAAASRLRLRRPVSVSWHGGLMDEPRFRAGVLRRLGPGFEPRAPRGAPELCAAHLALKLR